MMNKEGGERVMQTDLGVATVCVEERRGYDVQGGDEEEASSHCAKSCPGNRGGSKDTATTYDLTLATGHGRSQGNNPHCLRDGTTLLAAS